MIDAIENTADVFKALAEPNRLRIVMMLREREMCVCEITYVLDLDQSTVSRHLAKLKAAGLITIRRKGHWVYASIAKARPGSAQSNILRLINRELEGSPDITRDLKKAQKADRNVLCK